MVYYNNQEFVEELGKFNKKFTKKECCIRFLSKNDDQDVNYLCIEGKNCHIYKF